MERENSYADPQRWYISSINFFGGTASTFLMKGFFGRLRNTCLLLCQRRRMLSSTSATRPVATTTLLKLAMIIDQFA